MRPANLSESDSARRQAIVEAAARVFAEKGFNGATNRDIAREAGISAGLIYWYFESKQDLFIAAVREMYPLRNLNLPGDELIALPLDAVLTRLSTEMLGIMTHPDSLRLIRLGLSEVLQFPEVGRSFGQLIGATVIEGLATHLDARVRAGTVAPVDTRLAAQAFCGTLVSWVLRKYIYQSPDLADANDQTMIATTCRIFAAGLATGTEGDQS
jgi:AcrR family transcriptional regulator